MSLSRFLFIGAACALMFGFTQDSGFQRERGSRTDAAKDILEGRAAPQLMGEWFNTGGKSLDWPGLKGKVVVLDFWTHWCAPCREAVPHVRKLLSKNTGKGLVVIAVHSDANRVKMGQAMKQLGITWPVLLDAKKTNMNLYAADSFPDYYLVDRKGILRFADLANEELERAVEFLLAEKTPD